MHWSQRKKPELISMDNFWKKGTWPSKRSKKKLTIFIVFPVFFQNGTLHMASFCWIELSGPWHFIKAFKQPLNMIIFEKSLEKLEKQLYFFGLFWRLSLIFSKMVHRNEFWFFALQSVHQDASFKLSNVTIRQFSFFTFVRGYPY